METFQARQNHTPFTLYKRGVINLAFSNLVMLIIALAVITAIFYINLVQKQIEAKENFVKEARTIYEIAYIISKENYNVNLTHKTNIKGQIIFENKRMIISDSETKFSDYFSKNLSQKIDFDGCIQFIKQGENMEVYPC